MNAAEYDAWKLDDGLPKEPSPEHRALTDYRDAMGQVVQGPCDLCGQIVAYKPAYESVGDPLSCPVCGPALMGGA